MKRCRAAALAVLPSEVADKVSWLQHGQLHPRLQSLCEAGLVQRTELTPWHVTYGHTDRGAALLPVLPLIVTWAEEHLEKADRPLPAIEQIEDSLTLLTRRHAAAILWVLKSRGQTGGRTLARMVMPGREWTNVYPPLRQLVADGLVDTAGTGKPYRLSSAGDALGPIFGALSAWSAGHPLTQSARHLLVVLTAALLLAIRDAGAIAAPTVMVLTPVTGVFTEFSYVAAETAGGEASRTAGGQAHRVQSVLLGIDQSAMLAGPVVSGLLLEHIFVQWEA